MTGEITRIVLGCLGLIAGVYLLDIRIKKHRKIDTESIAIVKSVQYLGINDGKKIYAIRYAVKSSEPFELLETPCKKSRKPGTERIIFYEKDNPNKNYYFKTIGQFDQRFVIPSALLLASMAFVVSTIIPLI